MTFVNVGRLGVLPGKRDEFVAYLTRPSEELTQAGCVFYEVGINDEDPDAVFVAELWSSAEAHQTFLELPGVKTAIAEARPLLSGDFGGTRFVVVGSPLRAGF
jgi:quinol monooxygenase YgiN